VEVPDKPGWGIDVDPIWLESSEHLMSEV